MSGDNKKYFVRQAFILFTIILQSVSNGAIMGFPSVLNPAVLDPNSDIKVTSGQASWIASSLGIAGVLGFVTIAPTIQIYGRKISHMLKNLVMMVGWIVFYYAGSVTDLFVARSIQGLSIGGIYINVILIGEYVPPHRRGYFITLQKFAISTGALICHSLSLCLTWRQICGVFCLPALGAILLTMFWKESPYFLAMKGRYNESEKAYHWLNGAKRNKELQNLIATQKLRRESESGGKRIKRFFREFLRKDFQKSFVIVTILTMTIDLSGRNYFKAYIVQIMLELLEDKSIAIYCSIGGDILTLVALFISCFTVKYFNRRKLLLCSGFLSVSLMFILGLIIYSKVKLFGSPWLTPFLVMLVNCVVHIGVSPVCFVIIGEIYPLDVKGIGILTSGIIFTISFSTVIKLTPVIMENLGLGGVYLIFGSCLLVCFTILYFILPETKDKTLLEIEDDIKEKHEITDKNLSLLERNAE